MFKCNTPAQGSEVSASIIQPDRCIVMAALSQILHGCCSKPGQRQAGLGPDERAFGREGGEQSEPWFLVSKLNTEITIWKSKYKTRAKELEETR